MCFHFLRHSYSRSLYRLPSIVWLSRSRLCLSVFENIIAVLIILTASNIVVYDMYIFQDLHYNCRSTITLRKNEIATGKTFVQSDITIAANTIT